MPLPLSGQAEQIFDPWDVFVVTESKYPPIGELETAEIPLTCLCLFIELARRIVSTWGLQLTGRTLIRYLFFYYYFVVFVGGPLRQIKGRWFSFFFFVEFRRRFGSDRRPL